MADIRGSVETAEKKLEVGAEKVGLLTRSYTPQES